MSTNHAESIDTDDNVDQSMDDILESIRNIISDNDEKDVVDSSSQHNEEPQLNNVSTDNIVTDAIVPENIEEEDKIHLSPQDQDLLSQVKQQLSDIEQTKITMDPVPPVINPEKTVDTTVNNFAQNKDISQELPKIQTEEIRQPQVFNEVYNEKNYVNPIASLVKKRILQNASEPVYENNVQTPNLDTEIDLEPINFSENSSNETAAFIDENNKVMSNSNVSNQASDDYNSTSLISDVVRNRVGDMVGKAIDEKLTKKDRRMVEKFSTVELDSDDGLSDIVEKLLQPMLASWLDKHLLGIVEETIELEIKKLLHNSRR